MLHNCKYVTWRNVKPGDILEGWHYGHRHYGKTVQVKGVNAAYVTVVWNDVEDQIPSEDTMFDVKLTVEEYHEKYKEDAKSIMMALQNRLEEYEVGYHTMDNSWIDIDPYKMADICKEKNINIIGYCELSMPKHSFFGELLDVGICYETNTGEKYWCHCNKETLEFLNRKYSDLISD